MKTERLHVLIVDDVETEIEQLLILDVAALEESTHINFQFIEHFFVDNAVAVYEVAE